MEYILQNGKYDIVEFHSYEKNYIIKSKVAWFKKHIKNSIPIWVLEAGGPFEKRNEGYTDERNAQFVVKQYAQAFGSGIERYIWALAPAKSNGVWDSEPWTLMPLLTYSSSGKLEPKSSFFTYKLMLEKLKGFAQVDDLTLENGTSENKYTYVFRFTRAGKYVYVMWSDANASYELPVNSPEIILTHIITEKGQKDAKTESVKPVGGKINLSLTENPIFVEIK
jgi:hypothetical protein